MTGNWHALSSGYQPQQGDVAVYGSLPDASHVGNWVGGSAARPTVINGNWSYPSRDIPEVYEQADETSTYAGGPSLAGYVSVPNGGAPASGGGSTGGGSGGGPTVASPGYDVALQANTGAMLVASFNASNQLTNTANSGLGMTLKASPDLTA